MQDGHGEWVEGDLYEPGGVLGVPELQGAGVVAVFDGVAAHRRRRRQFGHRPGTKLPAHGLPEGGAHGRVEVVDGGGGEPSRRPGRVGLVEVLGRELVGLDGAEPALEPIGVAGVAAMVPGCRSGMMNSSQRSSKSVTGMLRLTVAGRSAASTCSCDKAL